MSSEITKKDFEEVLDKKFDEKMPQYQAAIIEAVDEKFNSLREEMYRLHKEIQEEIRRLTTTLDNFLKRLTDWEQEFIILKAEMDRVKEVIKEKLGVEVRI